MGRRARTCDWVLENNSEDIEHVRAIAATLLAGNPCAEAARSELEQGANADTQEVVIESVFRAVSILSSENCEASEMPESTDNESDVDVDAQVSEMEAEVQDVIEAAEEEGEGSLLQIDSTTKTTAGFMRTIAVIFFTILLIAACVAAAALLWYLIVMAVFMLGIALAPYLASGSGGYVTSVLAVGTWAGLTGGGLGLGICASQ